jgi:hypothetical protein
MTPVDAGTEQWVEGLLRDVVIPCNKPTLHAHGLTPTLAAALCSGTAPKYPNGIASWRSEQPEERVQLSREVIKIDGYTAQWVHKPVLLAEEVLEMLEDCGWHFIMPALDVWVAWKGGYFSAEHIIKANNPAALVAAIKERMGQDA